MKAIQFSRFGGPEVLEYVEIARPVPQDDELLIEVTAAGVNFPISGREWASISAPRPGSVASPCPT